MKRHFPVDCDKIRFNLKKQIFPLGKFNRRDYFLYFCHPLELSIKNKIPSTIGFIMCKFLLCGFIPSQLSSLNTTFFHLFSNLVKDQVDKLQPYDVMTLMPP